MQRRREYNMQTIGRNFKKYRLANGYSIEDVRRYMLLGSPQAIYKWERGEGLPQADTFLALMELYHIDSISQITEEDLEPFHSDNRDGGDERDSSFDFGESGGAAA